MNNNEMINKASTEGMQLTDITGKVMTADDVLKQIEYVQTNQDENCYEPYIYYEVDGFLIKYNIKTSTAYILNQDFMWTPSDEVSQDIIEDPNCYPRKYDVIENYAFAEETVGSRNR